jgi:hypothetical protein
MVIEHIIAGYSIPHNEGAVPLTKEAYDVNNPQKRLTDFSKTITIPENKTVNQIFEHAFDVNIDLQTFNPNLKTSYQIIQDGVTAIDGYCQLKSIKNVDGLINYEIQATGKIGDLFEKIRGKYLEDLDLSSLNHTWNRTNIQNSWSATIGQGYVYPMIDLGGRTSYGNWALEDFKPSIYVKQYIDTILTEAGFTYDSTFFNSDLFKRLIVPYGSGKILLDNAAILCKEFNVKRNTEQAIQCQNTNSISNLQNSLVLFDEDNSLSGYQKRVVADGGVIEGLACAEAVFDFTDDFYNTCTDEFDTTTGKYVATEPNKMSFQGLLNLNLLYIQSSTNETKQLNYFSQPSSDILTGSFRGYLNAYIVEKLNGVYTIVDSMKFDISTELTDNPLSGVPIGIIIGELPFQTGQIDVQAGGEYFLAFGGLELYATRLRSAAGLVVEVPITRSNIADFQVLIQADSTFASTLLETEIGIGDTIDTRLVIPKKIKQTDFLSSIIKRFNLYIEYDAIDANKLIIETRDGFLTDERVNLESKVDRSKDYNIIPMGALNSNRFIFKDQLDKDYHNDAYNKVNDEVYGQLILNVENDFIDADKEITTIFAPTPLWSVKNVGRIISSMRFVNEQNQQVDATAKIRLLYWGGLLDPKDAWSFAGALHLTYPYAGHLDNPYNPTFDLNWFVPKQLYYDFSYGNKFDLSYSNNNCFNIYWKQYIDEITDKNSKILECNLALRPHDYQELNFRKNYYIDGSYWRLLKVEDFDAMSEDTTKCMFLSVEPKDVFVPEVKKINGGVDDFVDDTPVPIGDMLVSPNGNSGTGLDTLQFGDSVKGGTRSIVASSNVKQSLNSKNSLIVGSDNTSIMADNLSLINSPLVVSNRPDETYINGLFAEKLKTIVLPFDVLTNLETEIQTLPSLPNDEFYEITRGYVRLDGNAATGGTHKIDIVEDDESEHILAEIPSSFFNIDNNTDLLNIIPHNTTPIHFGSGLKITTNSAMSFDAGTSLIINLVYRIIKL